MANSSAMRGYVATAFAAGLALAAAVLMGYLVALVGEVKGQRTDLAELRDVKYGLLDADAWVERVAAILGHKVEAFELTEENRPEIRENVGLVLDRLIVEVDDRSSRSLAGRTPKIKVTMAEAIEAYPDHFAVEFIPANPEGHGESLRYLRIGQRQFWLGFASANHWRSRAGEAMVGVLAEEKPLPEAGCDGMVWSLFAIDCVLPARLRELRAAVR